MNFAYELGRHGVHWSISSGTATTARGNNYRCMAVSVVMEDGTTFSDNFGLGGGLTLDRMLVAVLRTNAKDHPVLRGWYSEHGNDEITLVKGALGNLGEFLHVALRKCADSKQSVVTWNAIHHLHPSDWAAMLEAAANGLRELKKEGKKLTRLKVGCALKESITACLDRLHDESRLTRSDPDVKEVDRTELNKFALRMMLTGVEMTENTEWTWGWAGYLCADKPAPAAKPAQSQVATA